MEKSTFLHMRVSPDFKRQLDELRKQEPDLPSQAEMVRRLVERASSPAKWGDDLAAVAWEEIRRPKDHNG